MEDLQCINCGNKEVQNVQVIYESGTSNYKGKRSGIGLGISLSGIGVGIGGGRQKGTSRTELANRLSPPFKKRIRSNVIWFLIINLVFTYFMNVYLFWALEIINIGFGVYKVWWNKKVWPRIHADWQRQFFCHRCGNLWLPDLIVDEVAVSINQ